MALAISRITSRSAARAFVAGSKPWFCQHSSAKILHSSRIGFATTGLSMDLLKELRARSGAPIIECKKALKSADNDISAAMDWLREHGAAKASSKVHGRETSEGLVGLMVSDDSKSASLVKLSCETDFAARSSMCVDLVLNVAKATLSSPSSSNLEPLEEETILNSTLEEGKTVKDLLNEAIVAIRENLSLPTAIRLDASSEGSIFIGYVHNRISSRDGGTAAAVVELAPEPGKEVSVETLQSVGKLLAMHVVAARPQFLSPEDIPADVLAKEKEILTKQQEGSGKPPEILEKVVLGRLRKFYEGVCLTEQPHMIEEKNPKVAKVLKERGIAIKRFEALAVSA